MCYGRAYKGKTKALSQLLSLSLAKRKFCLIFPKLLSNDVGVTLVAGFDRLCRALCAYGLVWCTVSSCGF